MRMSLQFWDDTSGLDLQSTDFEAIVLVGVGNGMSPATPNYIDLGTSDPIPGGKTLAGTLYTFQVKCLSTTDTGREAQRDTLSKWFRPNDFTFRKLVGYDIDNLNKDWYLEGYPVSAPILQVGTVNNVYNITLALKVPYWIEADLQTNTWNITSATATKAITTSGNIPALPVFEITAISPKSSNGIAHKDFYAIHTSGWGHSKIGIDLTNGGLNTIGMDALASGNDVGVNVNGIYVNRWFGNGWNNVNTKIWVNLKFTPAPAMLLQTALDGSTLPASIEVSYVGSVTLSQNSTLQIGSELITYSSYTVNSATKILTFVPVARNAKGSSIAIHSIGASVYWVENEIWLTYGNPAAPAPVIDDTEKPAFDLDASNNVTWVYYEFGNTTGLRVNAPFKDGVVFSRNTGAGWYTGSHGALADPATDIGMYEDSLSRAGDTNTEMNWVFNHPGGISNFAGSGARYRIGTDVWDSAVFARIKNRSTGWFSRNDGTTYYTITAPTLLDTWEEFSFNVATPDSHVYPYTNVVFNFLAVLFGTTSNPSLVRAELHDATQTNFDPPTITKMGTMQENYNLGGSLSNSDMNQIILFNNLITKTGITFTIDCAEQEIYSADGKRLRGMIQFGGTKRDEWMTLSSNSNTLAFSDVGTVAINIVTKWRGRNTI